MWMARSSSGRRPSGRMVRSRIPVPWRTVNRPSEKADGGKAESEPERGFLRRHLQGEGIDLREVRQARATRGPAGELEFRRHNRPPRSVVLDAVHLLGRIALAMRDPAVVAGLAPVLHGHA